LRVDIFAYSCKFSIYLHWNIYKKTPFLALYLMMCQFEKGVLFNDAFSGYHYVRFVADKQNMGMEQSFKNTDRTKPKSSRKVLF